MMLSDSEHLTSEPRWLLYGANGYTGELIAREAVARGMRPILAGRNEGAVRALARELGCEARVFGLDDVDLQGVQLVLHCAGPFVHTSAPMVDACLRTGVHYLDITGEIAVFEAIFARQEEAVRRQTILLPGVGFDVVPTDCLAGKLAKRLPDATHLWLAFDSRGGLSRGTLKTMIEGAAAGGAIREDRRLRKVPLAWDVKEIPFAPSPRTAMTIPWGDLSTAFRSTAIPNIRVYLAQHPKAIRRSRRLRPMVGLLRLTPIRKIALRIADRQRGPDATVRNTARTYLWGRVTNESGAEVTMTMSVAEGYAFTVLSALAAVERMFAAPPPAGAWTPSVAFGDDFVDRIEGTTID